MQTVRAHLSIQLQIKLILLLTLSIPDEHMQVLLVYVNIHTLLGHVLGQDSNLHNILCLKPLVPASHAVVTVLELLFD